MKSKIKNINWKNIGWNALKLLMFLILNIPTIVMVIGKMISIDIPLYKPGTQEVAYTLHSDWFELITQQGPWYTKIIFYLSIIVTISITFFLIKWLIEQKKEEKRTQRVIEENGVNTNKIIEAIKSKEEKKEEKNVSKYL